MPNIDPILILEPAVVIAFSTGLVLYWNHWRSPMKRVLFYSLAAYAIAIAIKTAFQAFTYGSVLAAFGYVSVGTGLYFGLQTVILEVGLAYLIASYAVRHSAFTNKDAGGYGLGLAFWENGVFLGIFSLVNLVAIYLILAMGLPQATDLYSALVTSTPAYFYTPSQLLPSIGWGILERISSLLVHFSWGYLCVYAAFFHRRSYLLLALPMGMIDFFVVYAGVLTIPFFEILVLWLALISLAVALLATSGSRRQHRVETALSSTPAPGSSSDTESVAVPGGVDKP